jgi:tetratricopeptide (TPR) repeat protein
VPFDVGTKAQQRLDQIRAALATDKGLNTKQRNAELDGVKKKALLAEKAEDYEVAAEQFSRAASLAEGADKTLFADRAMECRRRDYQAKGMAMEELKNYAEAEKWYKRALDIKPDALLQQKLEAVQQKTKPVAPATSPFGVAFGEGQKALEAGELAKARVQFTLALGAKPGDAEATVKLKEVEGREALAKGDAYRAAGVLDNALSAYTEALQKCPALVATATARIQALAPAAPPVSTVIAKIDDLVRAQKDTEALAEAVAAVRGNPSSKDLKDAKTSIESLTACADVYAELQKAVEAGLSRIRDVRDIDDEDKVRDWRDGLEKLRDRFTDRVRKPRPLFLAHNYQSVQAALVAARADAQELADQLAAAADGCDHRAEKAAEKGTGVKGPFGFSLGIGGDRKKAEKYRTQAEAFKRLAEQAKAQSK